MTVRSSDAAALQTATETTSRRAILSAGIGAIAATVASALGRPVPVRAGSDGDVVLGSSANASATTTKITVPTEAYSAIWGVATAPDGVGVGVRGGAASPQGYGVWGFAEGVGVRGEGGTVGVDAIATNAGYGLRAKSAGWAISADGGAGMKVTATVGLGISASASGDSAVQADTGFAGSAGVLGRNRNHGTGLLGHSGGLDPMPASSPKTGVLGIATQDAASQGVAGKSTTGAGVAGSATSGIGVRGTASSSGGFAFQGSGRVRFDKVSGIATLAAGTTTKVITPGTDVTADSFVLLTPGSDIGSRRLWFTKDAVANTITIRMSSSRTSATSVSWLLLR